MKEYNIRYSMKLKESNDDPIYFRSVIYGVTYELAVLGFVETKRKIGWIILTIMEDLEIN